MTNVVAPNILNPFSVMHDLPLMESRKHAQLSLNGVGVHRIFVPSDLGGRLVVGFGKEPDPKGNAMVVFDTQGQPHEPNGRGEVQFDIPKGKRGDGVCLANVQAPSKQYSIYALFDETGFAREKDGSPLIPWNFWFWPFAESQRESSAWGSSTLRPLQKYEKAFKVEGVLDLEKQIHNDPDGTKQDWEGHCDIAAPATIMFNAPPDEGLTHRGVHFTCEELKLFAIEFFGRYGSVDNVWRLPGTGARGRYGEFQEFKPNHNPTRFGTKIAKFLDRLRENVRELGHALMMDLRDSGGSAPHQVWNHAAYRYATRFWQVDGTDLNLTEGSTMLYANADTIPKDGSSSGRPADVVFTDDGPVPVPNDSGRKQQYRFRVRFTKSGEYESNSSDNRWFSAIEAGTKVYPPRYANVVMQPYPVDPPRLPEGNVRIERADVLKLLSLRPRFE
jgi:hypothetical protein